MDGVVVPGDKAVKTPKEKAVKEKVVKEKVPKEKVPKAPKELKESKEPKEKKPPAPKKEPTTKIKLTAKEKLPTTQTELKVTPMTTPMKPAIKKPKEAPVPNFEYIAISHPLPVIKHRL